MQILDVALGHPQGSFSPAKVVISPGTAVTWVMHTTAIDSVTADDGRYGSALLHKGQTYTVRFGKPGTYRYHDIVHFITGEVVVR